MANNKWIKETIDAIEDPCSEDWLEHLGKIEKKCCKSNIMFFTMYTIPRECWYGYYVDEESGQLKEFCHVGYLKFEASDDGARQVADWGKKEVL